MSQPAPRSRNFSCLLVLVGLVVVIVLAAIIVPKLISSQAEKQFGAASPTLSSQRRLYLAIQILLHSKDLTTPVDPAGSENNLTIGLGEPVPAIAEKLQSEGLISNPGVFLSYLQYAGLDTSLKAGDYKLTPAMTPIEIAQAIQSSISADVTLIILPGWRLEEVANALPSSGFNITAEEFFTAVHSHPDGYSFSNCMADDSLEGYLLPGSYTQPREATINDLLTQILMNFESQVTPEMRSGFTAQGLDLCQAVTLASIVEREAMVQDEMPTIASVFYNRLNARDVLASDPTVQYALGYNSKQGTWWTNPLSLEDMQVDSPYNTYHYAGLPPGPISNPGLEALKAVAFPAETPYYYFRAACDGSGRHLFSETFDEHLANECP